MIAGRPASVSCTGKIGYETRSLAKRAIKTLKSSGKLHRSNNRLSTYPCGYCGYFHNGHFPANWDGEILDYSPDLAKLRQVPRTNGPVVRDGLGGRHMKAGR